MGEQYFFHAVFKDGTSIVQDKTDTSATNPKKSQFFDVLKKKSPLISFVLLSESQSHSYGVDLRDGHFEVDGVPFFPFRNDTQQLTNFRIIYLRNNTLDFTVDRELLAHRIGYTVGFQAKDKSGKNVKYIMNI